MINSIFSTNWLVQQTYWVGIRGWLWHLFVTKRVCHLLITNHSWLLTQFKALRLILLVIVRAYNVCYDCNWWLDPETLKLWLLWRLFVTKKQDVFKGATLVYAGSLPSQHRRSAWIQIVWKLGALCVLTKKTFFYYTITLRWSHQVYFVSTLPIIIYLCLMFRMIVKGQ